MKQSPMRTDRIELMKLLYQYDFYGNNDFIKDEAVTSDLLSRYNAVILKLDDINQIIEDNLFDYSIKALNAVDRAIIRLAVFEMLEKEIPVNIIIDEALEITKEFSNLDDEKQHRFTNRLLDNINKSLK